MQVTPADGGAVQVGDVVFAHINNRPRYGIVRELSDTYARLEVRSSRARFFRVPLRQVLPVGLYDMPSMQVSDNKQSITCGVCLMVSASPEDIRRGYCGYCRRHYSIRDQWGMVTSPIPQYGKLTTKPLPRSRLAVLMGEE